MHGRAVSVLFKMSFVYLLRPLNLNKRSYLLSNCRKGICGEKRSRMVNQNNGSFYNNGTLAPIYHVERSLKSCVRNLYLNMRKVIEGIRSIYANFRAAQVPFPAKIQVRFSPNPKRKIVIRS